MGSTGANMIAKSVDGKPFATTSREWQLRQGRYFRTGTSGEECLPETSRPGLIAKGYRFDLGFESVEPDLCDEA